MKWPIGTTRNYNKLLRLYAKLGLRLRFGEETTFKAKAGYKGGRSYWVLLDRPAPAVVFKTPEEARRLIAKEAAHELGHYLAAPKGRRHRQNYGIPDEGPRSERSNDHWALDEAKARIVECYTLRCCGFSNVQVDPLRGQVRYDLRKCRKEAYRWWRTEGQKAIDLELQ